MVAGHRQVAGQQHEVVGLERRCASCSIWSAWSRHRAAYRSRRSGRANERCRSADRPDVHVAGLVLQVEPSIPGELGTKGLVRLSCRWSWPVRGRGKTIVSSGRSRSFDGSPT